MGSKDQQLHGGAEPQGLGQPPSCFRTVAPKGFRVTGNSDKRHTSSYYLIVHAISVTHEPLEVPVVSQAVWRRDQYFPGKKSYSGAVSGRARGVSCDRTCALSAHRKEVPCKVMDCFVFVSWGVCVGGGGEGTALLPSTFKAPSLGMAS